jgi:filamentous hemagglutinin family protein
MTSSFKNRCEIKGMLILAILVEMAIASIAECARAQSKIEPDNTLGNERSVVRQEKIKGIESDRISGGATRGANLFHSFREFNVSEGRGAYFVNPKGVENILSRVTGNNVSQILGKLGVLGNANLFLMNPNGIIFGKGASLDIKGSFVATTANAIQFGDRGFFSTTNPQSPSSLLTVNPSAFFFNQIAVAQQPRITINSSREIGVDSFGNPVFEGLNVPDGQSLLLVGGEIFIDGGKLFAPGGRVELAGVGGTGTVRLNINGNFLNLDVPDNIAKANISLIKDAEINVHAGGGGDIAIDARNLDILKSSIQAGIDQGLGSKNSKAGDIEINVTGEINLRGTISNNVRRDAIGKGGNISIATSSLNVTKKSVLSTVTYGRGDAGNISIKADDTISFKEGSVLQSATPQDAVGNGGNIQLSAKSLKMTEGSYILSTVFGQGNAGAVSIKTDGIVWFDGVSADTGFVSGIFSTVEETGTGKAGAVRIEAGSLYVTNGAQLDTSTFGKGDAGRLIIKTRDLVSFRGFSSNGFRSAAFSSVESPHKVNGGEIRIKTNSLYLTNFSQLAVSTSGKGKAGNITINADKLVYLDGEAAILTAVQPLSEGNGGDITIYTGNLSVTDNAQLGAFTRAIGNAGDIFIEAKNGTVSFERGGSAVSSADFNAKGDAGNINIAADKLYLTNGAQLATDNNGQGNSGKLIINTTDIVSFDGLSVALTLLGSNVKGNGGDINITTDNLSFTNGARLVASTYGIGNGGNIIIKADGNISFDGKSAVLSSVEERAVGRGGNINMTTKGAIFVTNGAQLNASANGGTGNAGNIWLKADSAVNISGSGLFASTSPQSTGQGGNITINTGEFTIRDRAQVTASSSGTGNAGNISQIAARNLTLDNGSITTTSLSGNGGNIENIDVQNVLLLRNGSQISTTSGTQESGGGDGGKINLNAGFIIAAPNENNKITANAFDGRGGTINIATNGIFGLAPNRDITASSSFGIDGTVALTILEIDPVSGLARLPSGTVDRASLIAQDVCSIRDNKIAGGSSFVITGKGGLPNNPNEPLSNLTGTVEWANFDRNDNNTNVEAIRLRPEQESTPPIQEAQGWIQNPDGTISLLAQAPIVTPQSPNFKIPDCSRVSQTD